MGYGIPRRAIIKSNLQKTTSSLAYWFFSCIKQKFCPLSAFFYTTKLDFTLFSKRSLNNIGLNYVNSTFQKKSQFSRTHPISLFNMMHKNSSWRDFNIENADLLWLKLIPIICNEVTWLVMQWILVFIWIFYSSFRIS